jgi:pimeloyl-ACP methyl ester carboxylesterase
MRRIIMKKVIGIISIIFIACLIVQLNAPAFAKNSKPAYFVDESKLPFDAIPGIETKRYWGIHNGAGYRIEVPSSWNEELVVWAHGYRGDGLELTVDDNDPPHRAWLIANGYAWAASSYSKNAYDVAQGAKDTHALTKLFNGLVGKPKYTYISGVSMGGQITAVVIEQWPNSYDGAMPMCGVMADYELFDFFLDFNLVAQALAGVDAEYPPSDDYMTVTVPYVKSMLEFELFPGTFPFTLNTEGEQLKAVTELRSGGERPIFDQGFLFWNGVAGDFLFGLGTGTGTLTKVKGIAVNNIDIIYQFDNDPTLTEEEQTLNENVLRLERDPQSKHPNGLANVPVVSGDITIPVLTLHTIGDLFVPFSMEQIYAQRVAENGASHLLLQRAIRDFGHCTFTAEELIMGFVELVSWVKYGITPEGDDILDPAVVAHPEFGCTFTSEDREYPSPPYPPGLSIPACPQD